MKNNNNKLSTAILLTLALYASSITYSVAGPLYGYCAGISQCIDNGTNSPTTNSPPIDFGFTNLGGSKTGEFFVDILVPNHELKPVNFVITGSLSGTANLFSSTAWTHGSLDTYLGIVASANNSFNAFADGLAYDPGATGFYVYQVDLGSITLNPRSKPNLFPLLNILNQGPLPSGTYIVGFLKTTDGIIGTAKNGAILDPINPVPEPETIALGL